jgi:hypothetical protein
MRVRGPRSEASVSSTEYFVRIPSALGPRPSALLFKSTTLDDIFRIMVTLKKYANLAAIGALGVAGGCAGLLLIIAWAAWPSPTGGIDRTQALQSIIVSSIAVLPILIVHIIYALQLFRYHREGPD